MKKIVLILLTLLTFSPSTMPCTETASKAYEEAAIVLMAPTFEEELTDEEYASLSCFADQPKQNPVKQWFRSASIKFLAACEQLRKTFKRTFKSR